MARRSISGWCFLLVCLLTFAACGLKAPPQPRTSLLPAKVADLSAGTAQNGIALRFSVPQYEEPSRKVSQVRLYFGYLPLTGNPDCPPCPPRLQRYRTLELMGKDNKLMQGGSFTYLDTNAPTNKDAFYQVVLVDASGRKSEASNLAHAPRVALPDPPTGLVAQAGENQVALSWQGAPLASELGKTDGLMGWLVIRRDAVSEKQLVARHLTTPELIDKTVSNGQSYSYAVTSVHRVQTAWVQSETSKWVSATPQDTTPPSAPVDLAIGSSAQGVHLRFTPSPERDTAGYLIFRAGKKAGPWSQVGGVSVENAVTDMEVKAEKMYYYKVQAVDEAGNKSAMSQIISIKHQP